jgi:hypothetical protein
MAYDPKLNGLLLFGGIHNALPVSASTQLNDTWLWDGNTWKLLDNGSATGPPVGLYRMVPDDAIGSVLLLGFDGTGHWQQWTWDRRRWQKLKGSGPQAISQPTYGNEHVPISAVYDPSQGAVLVFSTSGTAGSGGTLSAWKGVLRAGSSATSANVSVFAGHYEGPTGGSGGAVINRAGSGKFSSPDLTACPSCSDGSAPRATIDFKLTRVTETSPGYRATGVVTAESDPKDAAAVGPVGTGVTATLAEGCLTLSLDTVVLTGAHAPRPCA